MTAKKFLYIILAALLLRLIIALLPTPVHTDLRNSLDWGTRFWQYGPKLFFESNVWSFDWPNQPPGTILLYAGIRKLFELFYSFFWFLNVNIPVFPSNLMFYFERDFIYFVAKIPTILADFGIALLIYKIILKLSDKKKAQIGALLFLLNPVIIYNSVVWGQYESVNNFFAVLAFYLLFRKNLNWAIVSLIISLYIKISLLIYVPVFLIVALAQKYKPRKYFTALIVILVTVFLLFLPFSKNNTFYWIYDFYKSKVMTEQLQLITANAFNIWAAVKGIHARPHDLLFGPLPFKIWGYILFFLSYIPVLFVLAKKKDTTSTFWSLSIVTLSSFMLLTNMHERYLYPFFTTFIVVAVLEKGASVYYYLLSAINLLNLYNFWWIPKIDLLIRLLSYQDRLATRVLGLGSFMIYIAMYKKYLMASRFSISGRKQESHVLTLKR